MTQVAEGDWSAAVEALDLALAHRRAGRRPRRAVEPRQRRPPAGRRRRPSSTSTRYALSRAREAGAVTAVVYCLQRLCFGHYLAGDLVAVRSSAEEALALGESIGQPAMTALPIAWLDPARGAPGPRRLRRPVCAGLDGARRGAPAGHPDRPRARPDPLGQGAPCRRRRGQRRRPAPPRRFRLPVLARMAAAERIEAAVRAGETATWPGLGRGAGRVRRGHRTAVGTRHGRLRAGDDGRPERGRGAVPGGAGPARPAPAARSTRRAPSWPTASGCAAASAASTPASTCATPWRRSRTCAPKPWPHARTRSCAPPARPPASATPPRW